MTEVKVNMKKWDKGLYNDDLVPTPSEKRNWSWWSFSTLWMGIAHNVPAWVLAAGMIGEGMSFWQAMSAVLIAYGVVYVAIILNSISGSKYGLPFPVIIRAAFGYKGSKIPILIRGFLGIFWFGVFLWIGGEAIQAGLGAIFPWWTSLADHHVIGMSLDYFISYVICVLIHVYMVTHGIERIRRFEVWAGPLIMIFSLGLLCWALSTSGLKPIVTHEATLTGAKFWSQYFLSISGLIGSMATLIVNNPDLTRFAKSSKDQLVGQFIGIPISFLFFSCVGLLVTIGTVLVYGHAISDPLQLLMRFNNPIIVLIGAILVFAAAISCNLATNAVSVGFDLAALFPNKLNFSRAGWLAIVVGIISAPWLWYGNSAMVDTIMGALGASMGPIAGIMLVDFYIVRKRLYDLNGLYIYNGPYAYTNGFNIRAILALVIGMLIAFTGLIIPSLSELYAYNWFLGIAFGGLAYAILMSTKIEKADVSEIQRQTL